jgi:hypothetical protein
MNREQIEQEVAQLADTWATAELGGILPSWSSALQRTSSGSGRWVSC